MSVDVEGTLPSEEPTRPREVAPVGGIDESDQPLRGELFSAERLCEHARELAREHETRSGAHVHLAPLVHLVGEAEAALDAFNTAMSEAVRDQRPVSAAVEWLLDNYYLIQEQVREIKEDLPAGYVAELPRLKEPPWKGFPRVWHLAVELICHTDARLDSEYLESFIMAYQEVAPLAIGEVWAVPIMLRIALVENVRRLAAHVMGSHRAEAAADSWADRLLLAAPDQPVDVARLAADLARDAAGAPAGFYIRLSQRLQGLDVDIAPVSTWLDARVSALGGTLEALIMGELQTQASNHISIATSITSIRFLTALDWRAFFEATSLVERVLRDDPAGVYERMDFASRDRYRHALEAFAKRCPYGETDVAVGAVSLARRALEADPTNPVKGHVGHYLISGGRYEFERALDYQPIRRELTHRGPLARRGVLYWGSIVGLSTVLTTALGAYLLTSGTSAIVALVLMMLSVVPLSDLVLHVVNRAASVVWPPRMLPKLDPAEPVTDANRTLVVIPALLTSAASAQELVDALEVHYLSNEDPNIHFGLLGDLKGGPAERAPGDVEIIEAARQGLELLNDRYGAADSKPFHLLVRMRRFNETQGVWMGWERKRGALDELNHHILGNADTAFLADIGDHEFLRSVTFVLTLDADTILPRDTAKRLICTIAHPLNRAQFDRDQRKVTRGYGLIQPRVSMSLRASRRSLLAWLYSGTVGVDPYAGAVSDTYQDVFGEGSYTGKGIYEVSVLAGALEGRIPENQLLSHDLLEGSYVRTGLASDIEVLDDYPSSYAAHIARQHRWVRGDWQTLFWLMPTVPLADGTREPNPLSALSRWKLFDNLRRSLFAPNMLLLMALGWLILPGPDWAWSLILLVILLFPVYTHLADSLLTHPGGVTLRSTLYSLWLDFGRDGLRAALTVATLPHQAYMMTDAIIRASWRNFVSRRRMLEWETAAEAEYRAGSRFVDFVRLMWPSSATAAAMIMPAVVVAVGNRLFSVPLLALWLAAPIVSFFVSMAPPERRAMPTRQDRTFMRKIARRTWRFFDTFVTAEDNWLAPDNFQEDPKGEIAHRTSPTNVGLQLLTYLTAFDLGFSGVGELVERVARTVETMEGLARFHGHFYNWYDTKTLETLPPGYVSTVDSGNLAGYLATLSVGLLEVSEGPLLGAQILEGLADAVTLAIEDLVVHKGAVGPPEQAEAVRDALDGLLRKLSLEDTPRNLGAWAALLAGIGQVTDRLDERLDAMSIQVQDVRTSVMDVVEQVRRHRQDLERAAPWAELLVELPRRLREEGASAPLGPLLDHIPSLVGLAEGLDEAAVACRALAKGASAGSEEERRETAEWCEALARGIARGRRECARRLSDMRELADVTRAFWQEMDFSVLFDETRMVFAIGYNTAEGMADNSYYDMLASECRLASYVAIAKGDVEQEHWFRLGRQITTTAGGHALLSWSASMFEYLMPLLVMGTWQDTLLDQTYRTVVRRQIQYGQQRGVPWGVSESGFNAKDVDLTYQYQAFGVPGLGLKRGLSEDVVVAPYATVLAMPIELRASLANLVTLAGQGAAGRYGYYEAVDYTPGRVPAGKERAVVRTYMAHHQGMILVVLGNELTGQRMHKRFDDDPVMRSAGLLLQERVPRHVPIAHPHAEELQFVRSVRELPVPVNRTYPLADTPVPATHFLSNGRYSVMVTNAGGGYSRFGDIAVTRYREDVTRDCWGTLFYIKDTKRKTVWPAVFQPNIAEPDEYHVIFSADKAEYRRRDGDIETHTEIVVSPEDDVEIRRITLTNRSASTIELEVTSYFEVSLAPQAGDQAHKAFLNLFVETEALDELSALLFTRRPRSADEQRIWGFHVLALDAVPSGAASYETDRARFIGRHRSTASARAMETDVLSQTVGAVLDPVASIRQTVRIRGGESARLAFATGVAASRQDAVSMAEKYHDIRSGQRAAELAWTASQIELRDLGISPEDAVVFERLASRLLLTDPYSRLKVKTPIENGLALSALWSLGISGDLPILLLSIDRLEDAPIVRQALLAHQYWRHKGLVADLVVLNTRPTGYTDELEERLKFLVRTGHALQLVDKPGGVFLRRADQMHPDVLNLLQTVARAVLLGDGGPLPVQLNLRAQRPQAPPALVATRPTREYPTPEFERPKLAFDNGYGGFDADAHEYVIVLSDHEATPAPWINVMANPQFGSMVSEAGIGCTWALNSHANRLTTWNNDPVSDGSGEAFYLRDEDTGEFWSPTPLPARDREPYVIRHGRGYTRFSHTSHGIEQELTWFVPRSDPVRVCRLKLTNTSGAHRRITATHFVEWVLGDSRSKAQQRVVTWYDAETRMLTAHNHFNIEFPGRAAFLATDVEVDSYTGSRAEFIGRNGHPGDPAAMHRAGLGAETGRFIDDCGALMTRFEMEPGATMEATFLLGQTDTLEQARALVARYRKAEVVRRAESAVRAGWDKLLDTVVVHTPDKALDLLVNGPMLYQALSCRIWGRSAMYQSSGAFGFRDQLQDTLAFALARPELMREQIIEAARHQFVEGDVLHWWMPPTGRGVRTHISDDRHWLPFVVAEYVEATGDTSVLDVEVPYIEGPALEPEQEDNYLQPAVTERMGTIYEHCIAAIESGRPVGEHGLPLIGGGDWNDGMNRVGHAGKGESVWLAWFLNVVLTRFVPLIEARGDAERVRDYRAWASALVAAIEENAWDGAWYRRAYFDDGTPLGTRQAQECRIDAVAQAWATISGAGDKGRAMRALDSVEEHLVRWEDRLIMLLDPPFDKMPQDPGYIKGYVPGVRENGGQYTHGVLWVVLAHLLSGDGDEALSMLDILNPVKHAATRVEADTYAVEPYAIAADVYAVAPHAGRGGWTWYTGSAAWFYRVAVRYLLGLAPIGAADGSRFLLVDPCIPKGWPGFSVTYRAGKTTYEITVENPRGVNRGVERMTLDGVQLADHRIPIGDDGGTHAVVVTLLGG